MRGRMVLAWALLLAVGLLVGPVAATEREDARGEFAGSEREERELPCPENPEDVPPEQEPPGEGECEGDAETYQGYVWTNEVECADDPVVGQQGVGVYNTGDPQDQAGGIGLCNDGDTAPIKGRVVFYGSSEDEGAYVFADGDGRNSNEDAQGWARADFGPGGVQVRCGPADGKRDAGWPDDGSQEDCG